MVSFKSDLWSCPNELVVIDAGELKRPGLLATSRWVLGNSVVEDICNVVYVKPDVFEARDTRKIAAAIDRINRALIDEGPHCHLIGFGRSRSADS